MTVSQTIIKHLSEPWFTLIKLGVKESEGRVYMGIWKTVKKDDKIIFTNNDNGVLRMINVTVKEVIRYPSFHDYLQNEGLQKCLPGMENMNVGVSVYRQYYTVEEEDQNGVVGIRLK